MNDLEFHKRLISSVTKLGVVGDKLHHHIQDVWDDAIKSVTVIDNSKKNSATDEDLQSFRDFIVDSTNTEVLVDIFEAETFDRLWSMTDEELQKEKEFYGYLD